MPIFPASLRVSHRTVGYKKKRCAKYKRNKKLELKQLVRTLYIEDMIKTDLYADDTTLFLNDENDMRYGLNAIHKFSIFSGLEVNKTKSHAMWLGSNKNCTDTFFGFNWKEKNIDLGSVFLKLLYKCASHIDENWSNIK